MKSFLQITSGLLILPKCRLVYEKKVFFIQYTPESKTCQIWVFEMPEIIQNILQHSFDKKNQSKLQNNILCRAMRRHKLIMLFLDQDLSR